MAGRAKFETDRIETTLKRSEFGMTKYLPGIGDEVRVLVPVEAFRD
jgi:polyisoprenoid-binding protein YceI